MFDVVFGSCVGVEGLAMTGHSGVMIAAASSSVVCVDVLETRLDARLSFTTAALSWDH